MKAAELIVGRRYRLTGLSYNNGKVVELVATHSPRKHHHRVRFLDGKTKRRGAGVTFDDGSFVVLARHLKEA